MQRAKSLQGQDPEDIKKLLVEMMESFATYYRRSNYTGKDILGQRFQYKRSADIDTDLVDFAYRLASEAFGSEDLKFTHPLMYEWTQRELMQKAKLFGVSNVAKLMSASSFKGNIGRSLGRFAKGGFVEAFEQTKLAASKGGWKPGGLSKDKADFIDIILSLSRRSGAKQYFGNEEKVRELKELAQSLSWGELSPNDRQSLAFQQRGFFDSLRKFAGSETYYDPWRTYDQAQSIRKLLKKSGLYFAAGGQVPGFAAGGSVAWARGNKSPGTYFSYGGLPDHQMESWKEAHKSSKEAEKLFLESLFESFRIKIGGKSFRNTAESKFQWRTGFLKDAGSIYGDTGVPRWVSELFEKELGYIFTSHPVRAFGGLRSGGVAGFASGIADRIAPILLAAGGRLPGFGGGDRVPALLEAGEYVINKAATAKYLPLIQAINSMTHKMAKGGMANISNRARSAVSSTNRVNTTEITTKRVENIDLDDMGKVNIDFGGVRYPLVGKKSVVEELIRTVGREQLTIAD